MTFEYTEHNYRAADGLNLYFRDYGPVSTAKPAVLCLPGLTRNCRDFDALARRLAIHWRVIAPDLRGRGRSDHDPDWRNYQPQTYAGDMFALVSTLALERLVVIGTSLGGLVGMLMAAAAPQRLAGLVLNDIGPEVSPEGIARIQAYLGRRGPVRNWDDAVAQTREAYGPAFPDFDEAQWRHFARLGYREDEQGVPQADYDANLRQTAQDAAANVSLWPLFAALAATPMLVLRGEVSDILAADTVERMRAGHPDLAAVDIPRRGHAPTLDEPESIAAIEAFLARV